VIGGETDPEQLVVLLRRGIKAPAERVKAALKGRVTEGHRFLPRPHLRQIDALDAAITDIDKEVNRELDPFRQAIRQLRTIPGVTLKGEVLFGVSDPVPRDARWPERSLPEGRASP
jgi:transposase